MTALIIVGAVVLLLLIVLFIPVGINVKWDGEVALSLVVGFIKVRLMPKKEKPIRLRDFSKKNYEKMLQKEAKAKAKAAKKAKAKRKKKTVEEKPQENVGGEEKKGIVGDLWKLRNVIIDIVTAFTHHIRTDAIKVDISVGAEDAAKCALLYGGISQGVVYVLEFLDANTKMRGGKDVDVRADFEAKEIAAEAEFKFTSRVIHAICAAAKFGWAYITKK